MELSLKDKIHLIESDDNHSLNDKIELILVISGEKPASIIDIANTNNPAYNNRRLREAELLYNWLGLLSEYMEKTDDIQYIASFCIGKSREMVSEMKNASTPGEYGKCYGFPGTAVDAFTDEKKRLEGSILDYYNRVSHIIHGIPPSKLDPFIEFVFSADNFIEELKSTSIRWHNAVRDLSPLLYSLIGITGRTEVPYSPTEAEKASVPDVW